MAQTILSDRYGVWCAWCLGYIASQKEMELHHILAPKDSIRETFGFEPWVVPVHRRPEVCHLQRLQAYADWAGRQLINALNPEGFEERCRKSFYRGYLPACLLLRRQAWRQSDDHEEKRQNVLYGLNAAAGCGLGKSFVEEVEKSADLAHLQDDPDFKLYTASVHTNAGDPSRAASACAELEARLPRIHPAGSLTYAKLVRMRATIAPSRTNAEEAVSIARDSPDPHYHRATSKLALASSHEAEREYGAARDVADDLSSDFEDRSPSWWHSIQHRALLVRATILSEGVPCDLRTLRACVMELLRAQYASAFLDFVGIPVPDCRTSSQGPDLVVLTPTTIIRWLGGTLSASREEMTEVRCEAIFGQPFRRRKAETWPLGVCPGNCLS